ncbi:MAG TPA: hypothetical protein VLH08_20885 [Acidobacteriota bacterium]|nr:hypothetical protein [Acidobacteriota bacterium]
MKYKILLLFSLLAANSALGGNAISELHDLHDKALQAHLKSDVVMLLADESDDFVVVNNGEVSHPTKKEREAFLGPYLRATRFEVYKNLISPIVHVSKDETSGWVIAQISASGVQTKKDGSEGKIEFVCAWIELYEKRNGIWVRTGNVSNFK